MEKGLEGWCRKNFLLSDQDINLGGVVAILFCVSIHGFWTSTWLEELHNFLLSMTTFHNLDESK